jgi:hypothetical protein
MTTVTSLKQIAANRKNLVKARKVRNRLAYQRSLERARLIEGIVGQGATTETLAEFLGIEPQSVPLTVRRALARVREAENAKGPTEVEPLH